MESKKVLQYYLKLDAFLYLSTFYLKISLFS